MEAQADGPSLEKDAVTDVWGRTDPASLPGPAHGPTLLGSGPAPRLTLKLTELHHNSGLCPPSPLSLAPHHLQEAFPHFSTREAQGQCCSQQQDGDSKSEFTDTRKNCRRELSCTSEFVALTQPCYKLLGILGGIRSSWKSPEGTTYSLSPKWPLSLQDQGHLMRSGGRGPLGPFAE